VPDLPVRMLVEPKRTMVITSVSLEANDSGVNSVTVIVSASCRTAFT
jgi:hypothetical protein